MADDGWSGRASCGTRNRQRPRPIRDAPGRERQRERRAVPDLALDREVAAAEPRQVAADREPPAEPRRPRRPSSSAGSVSTTTVMRPPGGEYLIAFDMTFPRIWRTRPGSDSTVGTVPARSGSMTSSLPPAAAR